MSYRCMICRDNGFITLPVHRQMAVCEPAIDEDALVQESGRRYPCPECLNQKRWTAPIERVHVLERHVMVRTDVPDIYLPMAKRTAVEAMVGDLERVGGCIRFEEGPERWAAAGPVKPIIATLGVVSIDAVHSIEARIAARQEELAKLTIEEACHEVRESLNRVLEKRKRKVI